MNNAMTCTTKDSLYDVLKKINENSKRIIFILNDKGILRGVLTDGDIRTCLLKGYGLRTQANKVMNRHFIYAHTTDNAAKIIKKMGDGVSIVPIVDKEFRYVSYFEYSFKLRIPVASPELSGNEMNYLVDAFLSSWISSTGMYIESFEKKFAEFCDSKFAVSTSNGTSALHLALLALGIGKNDEIIVPDLTFAATINACLYVCATPKIVDIDPSSWCIDPVSIEKAITKQTKAIIPVHLYGQPCNMSAIMTIAKKHRLYVIEDCAEAHGATYKGRKVGSFGDIGCFSFYGNKVITTGEGGMCVTKSKRLSERMRLFKNHGMSVSKKYWHSVIGCNYRMTNLQAAIGLAQMEHIADILQKRNMIEDAYRKILSDVPLVEFQRKDITGNKKITWLVSVLVKNKKRNRVMRMLQKNGIDVRPFFYPLSKMGIYKKYIISNSVSQKISNMGINLPTNSSVTEEIIQKIRKLLISS